MNSHLNFYIIFIINYQFELYIKKFICFIYKFFSIKKNKFFYLFLKKIKFNINTK